MLLWCIACEISAWQSGLTAQLSIGRGPASASLLRASAAGEDSCLFRGFPSFFPCDLCPVSCVAPPLAGEAEAGSGGVCRSLRGGGQPVRRVHECMGREAGGGCAKLTDFGVQFFIISYSKFPSPGSDSEELSGIEDERWDSPSLGWKLPHLQWKVD